MMIQTMMKPGTYYVGDLCYVFSDERWNEVCDLIIEGHKVKDGEFTMADGTRFAIYSTKYGDGLYEDNFGQRIAVDSGSIGCISIEHIDADRLKEILNRNLAGVYTFKTEFETGYEDDNKSVISFGNTVFVDTDPQDDEEEDEEEED